MVRALLLSRVTVSRMKLCSSMQLMMVRMAGAVVKRQFGSRMD